MGVTEHIKETSVFSCYHCGGLTRNPVKHDEKDFCCSGCMNVYEILKGQDMCDYYSYNEQPGNTIEYTKEQEHKYSFLRDEKILKKLYIFQQADVAHIQFYLPKR